MNDYYLSAPTEAAMLAAIELLPESANVDIIGIWINYDPVTETITPVEGWHFNVRSSEPMEIPDGIVSSVPSSPWRVWA
jgi:hypothetical protein